MYKFFFKTCFDFITAIIVLLILLPILILIFLMILIIEGRPVFFIQKRAGIRYTDFNIIKFRTMKNNFNSDLNEIDRRTKLGNFLRKYSLDELPELINVLKGEMSLVGPRPLFVEYNDLYNDEQKKRLQSKPGITGLAQINGRNSIEWSEKFKYDVYYINNINFVLDLKIIFQTILQVIRKKNIDSSNNLSMPLFKGNKKN